ncbi:hypothetical protein ECSTECDG1313_3108 [Escherichia coli STEC_DG131-3]|nr:hypothetical protein ECSTECDG1313_3108 [Escherichia coli STEC_DG131-3]
MAGENIPRRPVAEGGQPDGTVFNTNKPQILPQAGKPVLRFFYGGNP